MSTQTSRRLPLLVGMSSIVVVASVYAFSALFVQAVEGPAITTAVHAGAHATTSQAAIGTVVHAHASVASSTASTTIPTGTVHFNLYANTVCSGTPTTQTNVALVGGVAESATTTVPSTGLSYLVTYNGDATSTPSQGSCTAVMATAPSTTLTTTLSTTTAAVGTFVYSSALLGNATAQASGTVAYKVYTNNTCTTGAQAAGVKAVTNAVAPNSDSIQFNTPGTYYFQAAYSGDTYSAAATSSCQAGMFTMFSTSTPTARIIVDKITVPSGATTTFSFDASGNGYTDFTLTDTAQPNNQVLLPGTYRITENPTKGWKLTSALCSRNGATSTAYTPGSNIVLSASDVVSCTFTNMQATSTNGGGKPGHGHGDNGNHKGWVLGLPFGILKKVFNGDFIPPGIQKNFGDKIEDARAHADDHEDTDNLGSSIKGKIKEMKEKVKKNFEE